MTELDVHESTFDASIGPFEFKTPTAADALAGVLAQIIREECFWSTENHQRCERAARRIVELLSGSPLDILQAIGTAELMAEATAITIELDTDADQKWTQRDAIVVRREAQRHRRFARHNNNEQGRANNEARAAHLEAIANRISEYAARCR